MSKDLTQRSLVETGDGSHSLFVPDLDEQYHHPMVRSRNPCMYS